MALPALGSSVAPDVGADLMPWARVDDGWWSHPKVLGLSLEARGLWVTALSWSCSQRRDVVPRSLVLMVADDDELARDATAELVASGLWEATEDGNGWLIHDWGLYQDLSLSEKRAEAGRKGGLKSGKTRSKPEANTMGPHVNDGSKHEANSEAGTHPIPSHPDPSLELLPTVVVPAPQAANRDLLFEAIAESCYGMIYEPGVTVLTDRERGIVAKAAKDLRNAGAIPEEVHRRAQHFLVWVGQLPTPGNLVTHWNRLVRAQQKATGKQMKQLEAEIDRADMSRRILGTA